MSAADLLELFDTNVFGPHRLTNVMLPALQSTRGRIVCIGSMSASITSPAMGPCTMSKHALEADAECLRQEHAPHAVAVSNVQPGAVRTDIGANGQAANQKRLAATPPPFDRLAQSVAQSLRAPEAPEPGAPESATKRRLAPPEAVATVVPEALRGRDG